MSGISSDVFDKLSDDLITRLAPASLLDIGPGQGKYSEFARSLVPARHTSAVEISAIYAHSYGLDAIYDEVIIGDGAGLVVDPAWRNRTYDLVVIGDCIEHMPKSQRLDLLNFLTYCSGYAGTPVRALHMIGEGRLRNGWRYLARHCEQALEQGSVFALSGPLANQYFWAVSPLAESARAFTVLGLDLVGIKLCAGADARLAIGASLLARDGVATSAWRPFEVELAARKALTLDLVATFLDNQPSALRMEVLVNGLLAYSSAPSFSLSLPLGTGDRISRGSRSLPGQTCQAIWNLAIHERATP